MTDPRDLAPAGSRLDELLEFPTVFVFRVMGPAGVGLDRACREATQATLGRAPEGVEVRPSSKGRWCSVRIGTTVVSADEIERLYGALRDLDGVRLVL
jgi:putative lipoic acid-binding regulatory protein